MQDPDGALAHATPVLNGCSEVARYEKPRSERRLADVIAVHRLKLTHYVAKRTSDSSRFVWSVSPAPLPSSEAITDQFIGRLIHP